MGLEFVDYFWILLISLIVFFAIDLTWLGWVAKPIYQKELKKLLLPTPNWTAAVIFYTIFVIGLMVFAIVPAIDELSLKTAMCMGALYGFFTYATYDLTNLATLKDWPLKIVIIDIIWGTVLAFSVTVITYNLYTGIFT